MTVEVSSKRLPSQRFPDVFNWSNDDNEFEKRSTKKGPEPEDVKVGMIGDQVYAFVGLERIGGFMTYNISNPQNAQFANYLNSRDFSQAIAGDVAPEGLEFIAADVSPTGRPLVLVGNEVSGTVSVNEIQVDPIKLIEEITLDQTQASLKVGETVKLNASIQPADTTEDKEVTWTSSDEKVATVTNDGLVTAIAAGSATITVQTKNGVHSATAAITVTQPTPPATDEDNNNQDSDGVVEVPSTDNNKSTDTLDESKNSNTGNKLPNTATNHFNLLVMGLILVVIGGIVVIYQRRQTAKDY